MLGHNATLTPPPPVNEPIHSHAPGTRERTALKKTLADMAASQMQIPMVIGGEEVRSGESGAVTMPHDHQHVLATYFRGGPADVVKAIAAAQAAWPEWSRMPWTARAAIFLRAAELLATKYRPILNAATMLGQSKTAHQAEIDAACELIDFWRFNVHFAAKLYAEQPESAPGMWNTTELRPLEGFVFAVTPFNFTSIAGNLPSAPALMGNTVVWKPASTSVFSSWVVMQILQEAGLPPGVINMVTGAGAALAETALTNNRLAGVHFTGSTAVFQGMWKTVGQGIAGYCNYPRIVGETGGKDFIVVHPSADAQAVLTAIVRGGYEYQGQKCSAASRVYVAESVWKTIRSDLCDTIDGLPMGDIADFKNFMGAVIDERAYTKIESFVEHGREHDKIIAGGQCDRKTGWFIRPTLVRTEDPKAKLMSEEIFGPVVTAYVYPDGKFDETLKLCDETSPYALTGAVFANDRTAINQAHDVLRHAAGNFYINDKPTGAVVGQQPFGGARASGTDDKAGSATNLMRWVAARTIKETFAPAHDHRYPYMDSE